MPFREITLVREHTAVRIAPGRGALVSGLTVGGREVLYLDRASFQDAGKNVRGGIPILFPFAGKLPGNRFEPAASEIPQHGFGRNRPWVIVGQGEDWLRCAIAADDSTRSSYPYSWRVEQTVWARERGLAIELRIGNRCMRKMPVAPGWHPYFTCPGAQKTAVQGNVAGIDPKEFSNEREFELGADAPADGRAEFTIPGLGRLALGYSANLRHLHFWSLPGADFICIEPFTGALGAINHPEQRVDIAPGQAAVFTMSIELA